MSPDPSPDLIPRLRERVAKWRRELATYPPSDMGRAAAAAVSLCAEEVEQDLAASSKGRPQGWQPIETAPMDGTRVILCGEYQPGGPRMDAVAGSYNAGIWWRSNDGYGDVVSCCPTHWMPLPDPPRPSSKETRTETGPEPRAPGDSAAMKDWLTPQDVANLTGFSDSFIRAEIRIGALQARLVRSPSKPRTRGRWRIARADALDYARRLGVGDVLDATDVTERTDE